ncbi:MAG: aminopeptidase P family protein [Actinobacteria bacterium]|nr:MAG: aminopeptidase P family protein [Actinomycetota bacterium]
MFDYASRVARLQVLMSERGIDAVLLTAGSDLPYFSGYTAMPLERITALVVPSEGDPTLFVPALEAPRVETGQFEMMPWGETDDVLGSIASRLSGSDAIAVGETMWSSFLLAFQERLADVEWSVATDLTKELRMRKEPDEIDRLRRAAQATDRVLARIPSEVGFVGRTESEIAAEIARMVVEEGHDRSWFTIVASGPDSASPHHETGQRVVQSGDMVVCDFGGTIDGYHSDVTRTFVAGESTDRQREVHSVVDEANRAGRAAIAPGVPCQEVDRAARQVIEEAGYGEYFIHRTGHGIGLEGHEHPYIVEGNDLMLEAGMTFSVEPGIYVPGEFGVRIEDIVACGLDSVDNLNKADRHLIEVG